MSSAQFMMGQHKQTCKNLSSAQLTRGLQLKCKYGNYLFIKPVLNGNMEVNPIECRKGDYFTFLFVILVLIVSIPRIIIPVQ